MSALLFNANADDAPETIWHYVQANFDKLNGMLPSARGVPFATRLAGCHQLDSAIRRHAPMARENILQSRGWMNLPGGARSLARAVERIRLCAAQADVCQARSGRKFLRR